LHSPPSTDVVEIDEEIKINENLVDISSKMIKSKDAKTVVEKTSKSLPTPPKSYVNSSKNATKNDEALVLTPSVPKLDTSKTRADTGKQKIDNSSTVTKSPMRLRNKLSAKSLSSPHGDKKQIRNVIVKLPYIEIDMDGIGVVESRSQRNKVDNVDDGTSDRGGVMVSNQADPGKKL
jgi:hypothetical protein